MLASGKEAIIDRADDPSPDDLPLPPAFGPHRPMLYALGPVAEFATSNIWIVRDGVAITPAADGSFLAGITRQRLIGLLRGDGVPVVEKTVTIDAVRSADEIFSSGNYGKVQPVTRFEDRALQSGPVYARARELYRDFAHSRRAAA
jgi:branched-chain amino acid aminotransferase